MVRSKKKARTAPVAQAPAQPPAPPLRAHDWDTRDARIERLELALGDILNVNTAHKAWGIARAALADDAAA